MSFLQTSAGPLLARRTARRSALAERNEEIEFAPKRLLPRRSGDANTWCRRDRSSRELAGRTVLDGKSFVVIARTTLAFTGCPLAFNPSRIALAKSCQLDETVANATHLAVGAAVIMDAS
jgi:hypothetical protein